MRFGKYKGKTLDQIASSDKGLSYLDWIRGQDWCKGFLKDAVEAYLNGLPESEVQNAIANEKADHFASKNAERKKQQESRKEDDRAPF